MQALFAIPFLSFFFFTLYATHMLRHVHAHPQILTHKALFMHVILRPMHIESHAIPMSRNNYCTFLPLCKCTVSECTNDSGLSLSLSPPPVCFVAHTDTRRAEVHQSGGLRSWEGSHGNREMHIPCSRSAPRLPTRYVTGTNSRTIRHRHAYTEARMHTRAHTQSHACTHAHTRNALSFFPWLSLDRLSVAHSKAASRYLFRRPVSRRPGRLLCLYDWRSLPPSRYSRVHTRPAIPAPTALPALPVVVRSERIQVNALSLSARLPTPAPHTFVIYVYTKRCVCMCAHACLCSDGLEATRNTLLTRPDTIALSALYVFDEHLKSISVPPTIKHLRHIVWCGVVSCRVVSCRVVWCGVVSCRVVWCHVVCRVVSCGVVSC